MFSGSNAQALEPFFSSIFHLHTKNSLKPISEIKIGDKVLSYDERTKTTNYQPVMAVIQGEQRYQLIKLTLDSGKSIETTAEHPFYIKGKGWNPASSLQVGEALQLHNGTIVVIKKIETGIRVEKVYNLTVANTHNYFVGEDGVLVHNCELTKKAKNILGDLIDSANDTARDAIRKRGGGGSQINRLRTDYADKTLGELAQLAADGDKEAKTALKIVKQASKKAQKYGGK